ncbi:MAG: ATP-binding cassette domain-containing protein [Deinococcus sp.]
MLSVTDRRTVAGRALWQELNLDVAPGDQVAVAGPSGSGKSPLLRALAGLDLLEAGEVTLNGRSQSRWPMPNFRSQVMYLPQRPALSQGRVLDDLRRPFSLKAHADRRPEPPGLPETRRCHPLGRQRSTPCSSPGAARPVPVGAAQRGHGLTRPGRHPHCRSRTGRRLSG